MGKHRHHDRWYRNGYRRRPFRDPMTDEAGDHDAPPRRLGKLPLVAVLAGLVLWSLLAWAGYALVDPILGWIAANAGLLADSGKDIANATGVGKEAGSVIDSLNNIGFWGQAIWLLRVIAKLAIIVVWALGAVVLVAAPVILPVIGRLLGRRRH